ncbi:MAG: hypothetical protein WBA57_12760 [Elainellaceae cyanobacterium]
MLPLLASQKNEPLQISHAMVFRVLDQFLALPLDVIVKVSQEPEALDNVELKRDFMMFNDQFVKLVNLHTLVRQFHTSQSQQNSLRSSHQVSDPSMKFLILAKVHAQYLSGFFIDAVPYMLDIPMTSVHPFPMPTNKRVGEILNHVAILPDHINKTIFLLNLKNV